MVIVSRPYNGCDPGVNLGLPQKLRDLGVIAIPMDCLPLDEVDLLDDWQDMYWKYGQKIYSAAHIVRDDPRLHAIYITNFACGPGLFHPPFLQGEDAGQTLSPDRSGRAQRRRGGHHPPGGFPGQPQEHPGADSSRRSESPRPSSLTKDANHRKVYIPYMAEQAHALVGAFQSCGIDAEVTPKSNQETVYWGRKFTSGKECYPCILTTGDMVRVIKSPGL